MTTLKATPDEIAAKGESVYRAGSDIAAARSGHLHQVFDDAGGFFQHPALAGALDEFGVAWLMAIQKLSDTVQRTGLLAVNAATAYTDQDQAVAEGMR
jgi:hypothetical protein